jgi:hypothetical protein
MSRKNRQLKVTKLSEQQSDFDLRNTTPAERWAMMWQLTLDAWAFKGESVAEPRTQRHIVRIFRPKNRKDALPESE